MYINKCNTEMYHCIMCVYRKLLLLVALVAGSHHARAIGNANEISAKLEPKLIEVFNAQNAVLEADTLRYQDEDTGISSGGVYAEMINKTLVEFPKYTATVMKLNLNRNEIYLRVSVGTIQWTYFDKLCNSTLATPIFEYGKAYVNMTDVIIFGNVSIKIEGDYLVPHIYELDLEDKGAHVQKIDLNVDGTAKGNKIIDIENAAETFYALNTKLFTLLKLDLRTMLEATLNQIPLDTIITSSDEMKKYSKEFSQDTTKANKIIDDLCKLVAEKNAFDIEMYDENLITLPQVLKDGTLKSDGISIGHGRVLLEGKLRRHGDFNMYDLVNTWYMNGYVTIDSVTISRNYSTKYDDVPATGVMKTVGTTLNFLFQLEIEKDTCDRMAKFDVDYFGKIRTEVTPEDTEKLINWTQSELRLPLLGHYRVSVLAGVRMMLINAISGADENIQCNTTN